MTEPKVKKTPGRPAGFAPSEETKLRIAAALTGRSPSPERRLAMFEIWEKRKAEGYVVSEETKKRISAARKGQRLSESHRQKIRDYHARNRAAKAAAKAEAEILEEAIKLLTDINIEQS